MIQSRSCASIFRLESDDYPEILDMYDWFPIVFIIFKVVVLGVGMFYAIKWHHDQAKQDEREKLMREEEERRKRDGEDAS